MDMNLTKEEKLSKLKELTEQFHKNIEQYKSNKYDEANTRVDFIDKLFELLDWDVRNIQGYSEQYREVVREDKVKIEGREKAPDYSFRIGGVRKFFVEAKKPSVYIKKEIEPSYQIRRYGYTAKLPLSILTDFEEFAVYDTRIKPDKNDDASIARIFYCTYLEYEKNWDFIYNTFLKEAILKGSFDRYIEENKNKKGTSEVDKELLKLIEEWRTELAKNIALRNPELDIYNLNIAVQKIIDRIIFLRIAEDKDIEKYQQLLNATKNEGVYSNLKKIFTNANNKYDAGLFREEDWLSNLKLDDKVLSSIIKGLYYPECPYEFSILPVEILGNIYEQFLGKTIRFKNVKEGHTAIIEEKPEVRKAGGVYYTPQYIVDYIIENTIGEKIKGKTPEEISTLKICDPACGSGSFLVGAYKYLLNYHLEYYTNEKNIKKALKDEKIYQVSQDNYRLTIEEKQNILVNNIFGVDIDQQAVEVTKLSLYLKLLENVGREFQDYLFKHSDIKLLPDLDNNIKCGNSLIGSDFYKDKDLSLFTNEDMRTINAFDWDKEFSDIFKNGGFDVVIGNPPYVKEYTDKEAFVFKDGKLSKYYEGKMDLWYAFACLSIDILKEDGLHSFIATNNWNTAAGASILRNKIINETKILKFIDFSDFKVFSSASIQTMIYVIKKKKISVPYKIEYIKITNPNITINDIISIINLKNNIESYNKNSNFLKYYIITINPSEIKNKTFTFVNSEINKILEKIKNKNNFNLQYDEVGTGIDVHQDFVIEKHLEKLRNNEIKKGDGIFVISNEEKKKINFNKEELKYIKPYFTTNELFRYWGSNENNYWIIYSNLEVRKNINNFPNIKKHLDKFKNIITSDFAPYGLHRSRDQKFFEGEKIISLRKTSKPCFTYTDFPCYVSQTYFIIKINRIDLKYLTGILNSKVINFWLYHKGKKQGDQLQIDKEPLLEIPIFKTNDKNIHDKLISLVDQMLDAQKLYHNAKTENDKKLYKQKIDLIDKDIDRLVYGLYGLTEEEIKIVEEEI